MHTIKSAAVSTKNHIRRHKTKYAVAGTVIVLYYAIHKPAIKSWTAFMEEKGINPLEYFNPEMLAEMTS